MLGFDLNPLRQRLRTLERRIEGLGRQQPPTTNTHISHAVETALLSPPKPNTPAPPTPGQPQIDDDAQKTAAPLAAAPTWRATFAQHAAALADLAADGSTGAGRQAHSLVGLGQWLASHAPQDSAEREDWDGGVQALERELRRIFVGLAEDEGVRREREAQRRTLLRAFEQMHAGEQPSFSLLQGIVDSLLQDEERFGGPIFDFTPREPAAGFAQHALHHGRLAAFLTGHDSRWRTQREPLVMAAVLMDVALWRPGATVFNQTTDGYADHPLAATKMLARLQFFDESILSAAAAHHERLDGGGLQQWTVERINTPGRMLGVVAAYLDHRRPDLAADAVDPRRAMRLVIEEAEAGRLDHYWAMRLLDLSFFPLRTLVELASGEWAEVAASQRAAYDPSLAALPIVRILRDRLGRRPTSPSPIWNLARRPDSRVVRVLTNEEAFSTLGGE